MIRITDGKGFIMTFPNGWEISVQIDPGNYSDNYYFPPVSSTATRAENCRLPHALKSR